jgi:hypothetical protein
LKDVNILLKVLRLFAHVFRYLEQEIF